MSKQSKPLRILMLHGFTQSGPLFETKTKALKKSLIKAFPGIVLIYPTAPMHLSLADIPGSIAEDAGGLRDEAYGWWKRANYTEPYLYDGLDQGLEAIAKVLREEGPFDGVVGFSQGGCAAGMVTALLESGRKEAFDKLEQQTNGASYPFPNSFLGEEKGTIVHPQFKFAVSHSGFGASRQPQYKAFYEPKMTTPMQHFIGSVDTVVSEERCMQLVGDCEDGDRQGRVVHHPGGHFVPTQKASVMPLVAFIREVIEGNGDRNGAKEEESVEDMDVPF